MAWQLIYTSAPRLLDAGRSGFGTVARHRAIPQLLVQAIERVSQFARLPGLNAERVIYSHRIVVLSSARYHVLSMIRSAGSDYTGRTNHIAHHVIATEREASECAAAGLTPADILLRHLWRLSWDEPPLWLDGVQEIRLALFPPVALTHSIWAVYTGNPEHAWLLVTHAAARSCWVCAPAAADMRQLFLESLQAMGASSWQSTFTTSLEPTDDPTDFRWVGFSGGAPTSATVESTGRILLNLVRPETLPQPEPLRQFVPAPNITEPSVPQSESVDHGVPFVERDAEPSRESLAHSHRSLKERSSPEQRPLSAMAATPWEEAPSRNARKGAKSNVAVYGTIAAIGLAGALAYFLLAPGRGQPKTRNVTEDNGNAPPRKRPQRDLIAQRFKDANAFAYYDDQTCNDIAGLPLSDADARTYCDYAINLLQRFQKGNLEADDEITTKFEKLEAHQSVQRLKALNEIRRRLLDFIKGKLSKTAIAAGHIAPTLAEFGDSIDVEITNEFGNFDEARALGNDLARQELELGRGSIKANAVARFKAKVIAACKAELAAAISPVPEAVKTWEAALNEMKIKDAELNKLIADLKAPKSHETTQKDMELAPGLGPRQDSGLHDVSPAGAISVNPSPPRSRINNLNSATNVYVMSDSASSCPIGELNNDQDYEIWLDESESSPILQNAVAPNALENNRLSIRRGKAGDSILTLDFSIKTLVRKRGGSKIAALVAINSKNKTEIFRVYFAPPPGSSRPVLPEPIAAIDRITKQPTANDFPAIIGRFQHLINGLEIPAAFAGELSRLAMDCHELDTISASFSQTGRPPAQRTIRQELNDLSLPQNCRLEMSGLKQWTENMRARIDGLINVNARLLNPADPKQNSPSAEEPKNLAPEARTKLRSLDQKGPTADQAEQLKSLIERLKAAKSRFTELAKKYEFLFEGKLGTPDGSPIRVKFYVRPESGPAQDWIYFADLIESQK